MDISIIFVTRNAEEYFERSLKGVYSSTTERSFEVIVVDSGSTDSTVDIAKRYPVRIYNIKSHEFHHGKTRNYGASMSRGDTLIFLTADAIPVDDMWLANLTAPLRDEGVAAVYGRQMPHNTHIFEKYFLSYLYPDKGAVRHIRDKGGPVYLKDIFFSDVNSAIRKSVWEKHKFDEDIVLSEDQEWAKRVLMDGYKIVYEPKAAAYHSHKYRLKRLFKRNFDSGASLQKLTDDEFIPNAIELGRYLFGEVKYILRERYFLQLLALFPYEACRISGFIAGMNERFIPFFLKPYLSTQPHHWKPVKKESRR